MMPSLTAIVCCALLFIVLGLMWFLGCSFFERKAPQLLVYFGFAFMVIRAQVVLTLVGVHAFVISESLEEAKSFAAMVLIMYGVMMVVTHVIKINR